MIIQSKRIDGTQGVYLNKIYKTSAIDMAEKLGRSDVVTISRLAELVERGRAAALALPDVRADVVARAKEALFVGEVRGADEIASAMINSVVEGQV
ncbi:MAG: hypothetical protein N3B12_02315 [Armatimonadetes bacterium]|nr:hypothetical protein [Armatimonadota bacterium]